MTVSAQYLELIDQSTKRVDGEAEAEGYVGMIEIDSWNWQIQDKEINEGGRGTGQGSRIEPSVFKFAKGPDRSTTRLIQAMHNGEVFAKASFTLLEELAGSKQATGGEFHLVIELLDVTVQHYGLSVNSGDAEVSLEESWEFSYRLVRFKYDQGALQVDLIRPPGASVESAGSKVDDLAKQAKALDTKQRQELIKRLGSLEG